MCYLLGFGPGLRPLPLSRLSLGVELLGLFLLGCLPLRSAILSISYQFNQSFLCDGTLFDIQGVEKKAFGLPLVGAR